MSLQVPKADTMQPTENEQSGSVYPFRQFIILVVILTTNILLNLVWVVSVREYSIFLCVLKFERDLY